MKWAGVLFVVLLALVAPVSVPAAWIRTGLLPEVGVVATLYVASRGTAERAAWFGIAIGLLATPWTAEPMFLRATVLGGIGFVAGHAAAVVDRERVAITAGLAAVAALVLRGSEEIALGAGASSPATAGVAGAVLASVVTTAIAAPLFFAAARRLHLLAPLERSFRDV